MRCLVRIASEMKLHGSGLLPTATEIGTVGILILFFSTLRPIFGPGYLNSPCTVANSYRGAGPQIQMDGAGWTITQQLRVLVVAAINMSTRGLFLIGDTR